MGCCHSTQTPASRAPSSNSHNEILPHHPTSTSTTHQARARSRSHSTDRAHTAIQAGSRSHRRPNAPLRKPKPWRSTSRLWTPTLLGREREVFWETRVTGQQEVWAAIRAATEMMREGHAPEFKAAQAILDASGVTCPTGRLGEGVWDERGILYKLPRWVTSDPVNIVEDGEEDGGARVGVDDEDEDEIKEEGSEGEEVAMEKKGEEKGKGRGGDMIKVKTRLSDRGTDVLLEVDEKANVRSLVRKLCDEAELSSNTKVKLAYMGKVLKDNEPLMAQGWKPGHVVNALVFAC